MYILCKSRSKWCLAAYDLFKGHTRTPIAKLLPLLRKELLQGLLGSPYQSTREKVSPYAEGSQLTVASLENLAERLYSHVDTKF